MLNYCLHKLVFDLLPYSSIIKLWGIMKSPNSDLQILCYVFESFRVPSSVPCDVVCWLCDVNYLCDCESELNQLL